MFAVNPDELINEALLPKKTSNNLEDALINKDYQLTDLEELSLLADELAIPQSIEELMFQLNE
jgi:hypothetical protein